VNRYAAYLIILLPMLSFSWASAADVPFIMNYQGSVKTTGGMPYNGNGFFKFALVDQAGTTTFWSNDNTSAAGSEPTASVAIPVSNGLFSVKLGDTSIANMTTDLSGTALDSTVTYIRTWFSDDDVTFTQLSPDQQIVSGAYAIRAQNAESATTVTGMPTVDINANTSFAIVPSDGSTTTVMQVSVTPPDDGFVLVTFTASASTNHTNGTDSFLRYFLADAEIPHDFVPSWQAALIPLANPSANQEIRSISTQRLFSVSASTSRTFYARFNIFNGNAWTVFRPYMSAVFIPSTTGALPVEF